MKVIKGFRGAGRPYKKCVLAMGVFDGVHLGHQKIIKKVIKGARALRKKSVVVTFDPHPVQVLKRQPGSPSAGRFFLTTFDEKAQLIEDMGVDLLVVLRFSKSMAALSPEEFVGRMVSCFSPASIAVGAGHTFGRNGKGTPSLLRLLGKFYNFAGVVVNLEKKQGRFITSTFIREQVRKGKVDRANLFLGRYFFLQGRVVRRTGRGTKIGFPTANLNLHPCRLLPADGVYAGLVNAEGKTYRAAVNVGCCPTFRDRSGRVEVEAFLENFTGSLYGRTIRIDFVRRIRSEIRFSDAGTLRQQISGDIRRAMSILKNVKMKGGKYDRSER